MKTRTNKQKVLSVLRILAVLSFARIRAQSKVSIAALALMVATIALWPASAASPEGTHDGNEGAHSLLNCWAVGWAADPDDRNIDLTVRILADGVEVARTVANAFRQDLADAGVCPGGTCGFGVDLSGLVTANVDHSITVQAQDAQTGEWFDLSATPKTLHCANLSFTFVVTTTDDIGDGVCDGTCTLREALEAANASPGPDLITFAIPGSPPFTIQPGSQLPEITDPVTIDGTTQSGVNGAPLIELDGSNAGPDAYGLVVRAGHSLIRGLVINRFAIEGVALGGAGNNVIEGNYLGTDVSGTVGLGNGHAGLGIYDSSNNRIGGLDAGA